MSELFPEEKRYYQLFGKLLEYTKEYLIDHEYGGWYIEGLDRSPDARTLPKASVWKVNYHTARTLINCIKILRSEFEMF